MEAKKEKSDKLTNFINSVGYKPIMGFVLGVSFVMVYDAVISDSQTNKIIESSEQALQKSKKEINDLKAKLKGCEAVCHNGDNSSVSNADLSEAKEVVSKYLRGTNVSSINQDKNVPGLVRIKTKKVNGAPIYYDPSKKILIVGLVMNVRDDKSAKNSIYGFTNGEAQ